MTRTMTKKKATTAARAAQASTKQWHPVTKRTSSRYSTGKSETDRDIPEVKEEVRRIWKQAQREGR